MVINAKRHNDRNGEQFVPRQGRRPANNGARLHDGPGNRPAAASGSHGRKAGTSQDEHGKPSLRSIITAVEEMREDRPRIDVGGLYLQFRCRGGRWALVTREDVRAALAGIECVARREFVAPDSGEQFRRPAARTPHASWPPFLKAVAGLRDRGLEAPEMVSELRASGWQATRDDVAAALRRTHTNTPRPFPPGRPLPAPRPAGPEICGSCGVVVTDLGLCRCS